MSRSTGPIVATGIVTLANSTILHGQAVDWRVPIATGFAAVGFSLAEKVWPEGVVILAWTTLLTVLLTRTNPNVPSPTESVLTWWNSLEGATT